TVEEADLLNVIRILQKEFGDEAILKALESAVEANCDFDPEEIAETAAECTDMDERKWYNMACRDEYGRYIDSGDHAMYVILENLRNEFEDHLKRILILGDRSQATEFLNAIAEGIEDSDGILAEEAQDFCGNFAEHLRECADSWRFDEAFDW
ncbi:MAG: hypothetical protein MJZ68_09090, partial [archaeon]|nr:hypothetical protein [archaeon]